MIDKLLRVGRIIVSLAAFCILTCGLVCPALMLPGVGPWLEKIQLGPAILGFSLFIFIVWLLVTLAFGRIYCSTVCPLGTLQDICARSRRMVPLVKLIETPRRYRYMRPATAVRYSVLVIVLLCIVLGISVVTSVFEPFSAFSRLCDDFLRPVVILVAKGLARIGVETPAASVIITANAGACIIATLIAAVTVFVSAQSGRTLCNTICPLGTAMGCVSRYSIYQMDIDTDLCIQCGRCEAVCKASCIDLTDHVVDGSRCVVCFDCVNVCPNSAIRYTWRRKQLSTPMMNRISDFGNSPETSVDSTCKPIRNNETISDPASRNS